MGKKHKHHRAEHKSRRASTANEAEPAEGAAVLVALDQGFSPPAEVLSLLGSTSPELAMTSNASPPSTPSVEEHPSAQAAPQEAASAQEDVPVSLGSRLAHAFNIDADTMPDIAPIGPTEPGQRFVSTPPASMPAHEETRATASADEIEQQIRELEAKLDLMIGQGNKERSDKPTPIPLPKPSPLPKAVAWSDTPPEPANEETTASEVLPPDFYARKWGKEALRSRSEEVDDFGLDPAFESKVQRIIDFLQKYYFRVEASGLENIPAEGRGLVVANHAGGPLPYDGAMLRAAIRRLHPAHRELRWLTEDFVYYLPFVGTLMNRMGAVRACQENAERLLQKEALVAVFPEGAKGIGKLYRERYQLQRFGRGGFIRLCLRTRTPIVPCAIIGAEEANPMLYRIEYMTKSLGIPYFPITPTFPALGALGLMPAPTKWKIQFGEPLTWSGYGPEAADDEILVGRLTERVRASIQSMLDRMLQERRSIWLG